MICKELFIFSTCTDVQLVYQNLSNIVMEASYKAARRISQSLYSKCSHTDAWEDTRSYHFADCNEEISASNPKIFGRIWYIQVFATQNFLSDMGIQVKIGQIMEGVDLDPFSTHGLETAIAFIQEEALNHKMSTFCCKKVIGCLEATREAILYLKLIEWGVFGLGQSTAGMFLANHYLKIGPYFGNSLENDWPHVPFYTDPSTIESTLNKVLMKITEEMSGGKLRNISFLDLPAFGSKIDQFEQQKGSSWSIETNFALLNMIKESNGLSMVTEYKELLFLWNAYLKKVDQEDYSASFKPKMANNMFLNFTSYIQKDMKTFLTIMSGSFPTAMVDTNPIWNQTGTQVFGDTIEDNHAVENSLYDKLIMDCTLKESLMKKPFIETQGGCKYFQQSLTSNGICYSFNGEEQSSIWRPGKDYDDFKLITSENQLIETFGGPGIQGKYINKS